MIDGDSVWGDQRYPVTGSPYDTIAIKQVNTNTFTFTLKKNGGKYNVTGRMVIEGWKADDFHGQGD
jgi:hypothetical protein